MTGEQLDIEDAIAAAEQAKADGIAAAGEGSGDWWRSCARQAFAAAAIDSYLTGRPFTAYDVAARYAVPDPQSLRAWGAIVQWAKRTGIVEHAGYVLSPRPENHRAPVAQWRGTAVAERARTAPMACHNPKIRAGRRPAPERTP